MGKHETEVPPPCNKEIFKSGKTVAVLSGGMIVMEGLVKEACRGGLVMDWHYCGGRAVVLTLEPDIEKCRQALADAIPQILQ